MLFKKILDTVPHSIRTLRRLFAGSLGGNITFQQFKTLVLTHEGMGATQIAQNDQISTAAVSKMVDALVKKGLLTREQGDDRRRQNLSLTPEGDRIRKSARKKVEVVLEKNLKKLTKKEQEDLSKGLIVLQKLMEHVNEK